LNTSLVPDDLDGARGILNATVLSLPLWGLILALWLLLTRAEESSSMWADESRRSVQQCEVQKIQFAILERDPPLKHYSTPTRHCEQIPIPSRFRGIGGPRGHVWLVQMSGPFTHTDTKCYRTIPTVWKGVKFRSRVRFSALGGYGDGSE
jgi:hypothetical protein